MRCKVLPFRALLVKRGLDLQRLAELSGSGRSHLSQVLSNKPGRGGKTRTKLFKLLTEEEIVSLGWGAEYADWLVKNNPEKSLTLQSASVPMEASQPAVP